MSQDPFGYPSDLPPPGPPGGPAPPDVSAVRSRVQLPAIFLIVVGVLNLLGALYTASQGFVTSRIRPEEFEKQMAQGNPDAPAQMRQMGWTPEGVQTTAIYGFFGSAAAELLAAL